MYKKTIILLFSMITAFILDVHAISLEQSTDLARKHNKLIQGNQNLIYAAQWQKKNAFSQFLPKVTFNETWLRLDKETVIIPAIPLLGINEPVTQPKDNYTTEISISQPLFASGKLYLNYKIADLSLKQTNNQYRLKEKELDWETAKLYFQILKLMDIREISQKTAEAYLSWYEKAQIKHKNGSGLLTEVLQWKVKYETALADLGSLNNSLDILLDTWHQHLGQTGISDQLLPEKINLDQKISQAKQLSEMKDEQRISELNAFLSDFKQKNLNKQNLSLMKEMLDYQVKFSKTEFLPTLALNFSYQFENDDKLNFKDSENWKLMALFSVPLFNSGGNYSQYKVQYYQSKQQADEIDNMAEMLEIGAKKTYLDIFDLALKIKSNTVNLELATENQKQVSQLFNQGMLTYNDMMDAEIMFQSVNLSFYSDIYDFLIKEYEVKLYRED
ncbi:MAG: TolC family protein [Candidatus Cloacimonetes bacterium]|nr:TolC family protein [Candidatus Cloacimonadota bacterium]HPM01912.1 TolC family protein [Candidatus Cloacimonadota bacterium]